MGFVDGLGELFLPGAEEGKGEGRGVDRAEEMGRTVLRDSSLGGVETGILRAIERVKGREGKARVLLVLDGLDLLLAATEAGAEAVADLVGELREVGSPLNDYPYVAVSYRKEQDSDTDDCCPARPRHHHHRRR